MKKSVIILSLLAALFSSACEKQQKGVIETMSESQILLDKTEFTEEALLGMIANKEAVTAVEYEALLRAIETCGVDEETLDLSFACPALSAMRTFRDDDTYAMATGVDVDAIKRGLLKSKMTKVKAWIIAQMGNILGVGESDKVLLLDLGKADQEPLIIKAIIDKLCNSMDDEDVADFILSRVDDKAPGVRLAVAGAVMSTRSKHVDGMIDVALKYLDDANQDVRAYACKEIGSLGNEKAVKPLVAILADKEQLSLHGNCMSSLNALWYDYPEHSNTSAAAYKASIEYLKQTPRTEEFPDWRSMGDLKFISKDEIEAWKAKADYFKIEPFLAIMVGIAADPDYNWMGRSAAIEVIGAWGTKKDLEDLKVKLASDNSDRASFVIEAIDEAIVKVDSSY